jgi:hypothetical protein
MTANRTARAVAEPDIWEELTSGQLDKELGAALRVLAEERDELAAKLEAYTPLDEAFRIRVTEALAQQLRHDAHRRRFVWLGGSTLLVSVAAAALFSLSPPKDGLPSYGLSLSGGVAETRGAGAKPGDTVWATTATELELTLRPARRVNGPVVLSMFLFSSRSHRAYPLQKAAEHDPSGAFRVVGSVSTLFDAPFGSYTLVAIVDRKALSATEVAKRREQPDSDVESTRIEFGSTP